MKKIVLTGGGSAGHVTPNIALANRLKKSGWEIEYIGSKNGIEKEIIKNSGIIYHSISSGKLRRYFSFENFIDPFKVLAGILESIFLIKKTKPGIIFSKGGFVTVPVVIAGYINKIPVIIHESDYTPGLANKIALKFASKICVSFPETLKYLPSGKGIHTGAPIRSELLSGNPDKGSKLCNFKTKKPVLLVIGGSLGSEILNKSIRNILELLLNKFNIVHICGKGNISPDFQNKEGYTQFEFVSSELPDIFVMADIIVSRAGSNAIFEFLALKKPNLLIPLSKKASRGDQILNANSFKKSGFSMVLAEEEINNEVLLDSINKLFSEKEKYIERMNSTSDNNAVNEIISLIEENYINN